MITRRNMLKALGLSTLSVPAFANIASEPVLEPFPQTQDSEYWKKLRKQFMLAEDKVFFNTGTVGVMPKVVVSKMTEHLTMMATHVADWAYKDDNAEQFISGYNNLLPIRTKVARILGCDAAEIAITDNVTHGMSYLANGITLQAGDEVVTTDQEHPGGKGGWLVKEKRYGVVFKQVPIAKPAKDANELYDSIVKTFTPKTKVLMLSHMISGSGAILPVKELCAEASRRGIFTILDGAQTVGHIKLNLYDIGCDAYVGCFHKWMGAPCGTGFMYVKANRMNEIWTTVASTRWDDHADEGFRLTQRGTGSFSILKGMEAALDFHEEVGADRVYNRIKFLGQRLRTGLRQNKKVKIFSPQDESLCAGITVYNIEGWTGPRLQDEFWNRARMRPRSSGEVFGVRHSTHIFNSEQEIDRAIEIVNQLSA